MTRESLTTDPRTEPPAARAWAAAIAPILLLAAISAYLSDGRAIRTAAAFAGAGVSIVLVVLLAGLALGRRHLVPGALTPIGVAVAAVMLLVVANSLPTLPTLAGLDGSWQAKLLNLVWLGILLACWPAGRRAVGLTTVRPQPGSGRPILLAAAAGCLVWFGLGVAGALAGMTRPPTVTLALHQLLLPGLDEELVFRGIALGMLVAAFSTPWHWRGAPVGWGLVVVTAVFAALHGISRPDGEFTIDPVALLLSAPAGLLLGWIRLRGGSIWPCVLAHNAMNTALLLGTAIV